MPLTLVSVTAFDYVVVKSRKWQALSSAQISPDDLQIQPTRSCKAGDLPKSLRTRLKLLAFHVFPPTHVSLHHILNSILSALSLSPIYAIFPPTPDDHNGFLDSAAEGILFPLRNPILVNLIDAIPSLDLAPRYIEYGEDVGGPIPRPYRAARDW